jgi:hypothetical protein
MARYLQRVKFILTLLDCSITAMCGNREWRRASAGSSERASRRASGSPLLSKPCEFVVHNVKQQHNPRDAQIASCFRPVLRVLDGPELNVLSFAHEQPLAQLAMVPSTRNLRQVCSRSRRCGRAGAIVTRLSLATNFSVRSLF